MTYNLSSLTMVSFLMVHKMILVHQMWGQRKGVLEYIVIFLLDVAPFGTCIYMFAYSIIACCLSGQGDLLTPL